MAELDTILFRTRQGMADCTIRIYQPSLGRVLAVNQKADYGIESFGFLLSDVAEEQFHVADVIDDATKRWIDD